MLVGSSEGCADGCLEGEKLGMLDGVDDAETVGIVDGCALNDDDGFPLIIDGVDDGFDWPWTALAKNIIVATSSMVM